ncbi:hypothetical protein J6590_038377 [Homalodisca vitripennis]|nr:hypothetical protein J6590_038377 [Homalodisca vitripennis]
MPWVCNLSSSVAWSTQSKALGRSRNTHTVLFPLPSPFTIISTRLTIASIVIPPPAKLFLDVKLENLHSFYRFAIIKSYATETQLRVVIKLPLKDDNQVYEVFNVITYPAFDPSLKRWAKWEVDGQKLIVSNDRQTYTVYSSDHYRSECIFGPLTVCPLSEVLFNVHQRKNFPIELLVKEKITLCTRKLISGLKSPVLIRTPTRWIYTTSGEAKVVLNCFRRNAGLNVSTTTLKGVGEIPNRDRYDLIADGYRMPARFFGSSWHSSDFGKITFPEVDGIYSKEGTDLLNQDVNGTLKVLQELDDQLGTLSVKEYSLESTFQHLRVNRLKHRIVKQVADGTPKLPGPMRNSETLGSGLSQMSRPLERVTNQNEITCQKDLVLSHNRNPSLVCNSCYVCAGRMR